MPRELIIGVSGGIATYKTADLVSRLVQSGDSVSVVMTETAHHFIGATTFVALTGRPVQSKMFADRYPLGPHIQMADQADLLCIAPATANVLAKAATGLADDLLSTLMLSFDGPIVLAPTMSSEMWNKPSVQRNVETLRQDGFHLVGPESGWLSCRKQGIGRMSDPEKILQAIDHLLPSSP